MHTWLNLKKMVRSKVLSTTWQVPQGPKSPEDDLLTSIFDYPTCAALRALYDGCLCSLERFAHGVR